MIAPPFATLADGAVVPLTNCTACGELGRADMAHYHVCRPSESECAALRAEVERLGADLALESELVTLHAGGASRAEAECETLHRKLDASDHECEALRAEVARLTEHRERITLEAGHLRADWGHHVAEIAALKKELVDTTDDALKQRVEYWRENAQAAESRLAAATELLRAWCGWHDNDHVMPLLVTRTFIAAQPAAPECRHCKTYGPLCGVHGQPAAPTRSDGSYAMTPEQRTDAFASRLINRDVAEQYLRQQSNRYVDSVSKPAAPTLLRAPVDVPPAGCYCPPDRCGAPVVMGRQMPCRREPAAPARTEADDVCIACVRTVTDQRVLEACANATILPPVPGLHDATLNGGEWRIAAAELARREAAK